MSTSSNTPQQAQELASQQTQELGERVQAVKSRLNAAGLHDGATFVKIDERFRLLSASARYGAAAVHAAREIESLDRADLDQKLREVQQQCSRWRSTVERTDLLKEWELYEIENGWKGSVSTLSEKLDRFEAVLAIIEGESEGADSQPQIELGEIGAVMASAAQGRFPGEGDESYPHSVASLEDIMSAENFIRFDKSGSREELQRALSALQPESDERQSLKELASVVDIKGLRDRIAEEARAQAVEVIRSGGADPSATVSDMTKMVLEKMANDSAAGHRKACDIAEEIQGVLQEAAATCQEIRSKYVDCEDHEEPSEE